MALFKNDHDLKDQLEATKAEVAEHEMTISKRESDIINITEQMAEVSEKLETRTAELAEATIENAALTEELVVANEKLAASMEAQEAFEDKVSNAALARMQELGVSEPVATIADDETDDLYTQYTNLKATNPAAAGAFWRANEAQIKASI
jgi:septal ring factor EnvC (AmiA/AmiB activator)